MTESELTRKVMKMLKKDFPDIWVVKLADRWQSGLPDLMMCVPDNKNFIGRMYAIELKVGKNTTTKIQDYILSCISLAGGKATVCRSVEEVRQFLTEN